MVMPSARGDLATPDICCGAVRALATLTLGVLISVRL
jgi:hypothetical protein